MQERRRRELHEFHFVFAEDVPDLRPCNVKFRAEISLRLLKVKPVKCAVLRERIQEICIERKAHMVIDHILKFLICVCERVKIFYHFAAEYHGSCINVYEVVRICCPEAAQAVRCLFV